MTKTKISIVIPVYNASQYISETIESVISQTYTNWELILVDDGSLDDSGSICDVFSEKDKRIQVFHQENLGVSAARNKGIKHAEGEWIIFIDSDDYVDRNMLEVMLSNSENMDLVVCPHKEFPTGKVQTWKEKIYIGLANTKYDFECLYYAGFYNSPWGKMYRCDLIKELFPDDVSLGEDLMFNLAYMKNCKKIKAIERPMYFYRVFVRDSLTKKTRYDITEIWEKMFLTIFDAFDGDNNVMKCVQERFIGTMIYKYLTLSKNKFYSIREKIKIMRIWRNSHLYTDRYNVRLPVRYRMMWFLIKYRLFYLLYVLGLFYEPSK